MFGRKQDDAWEDGYHQGNNDALMIMAAVVAAAAVLLSKGNGKPSTPS